MRLLETPDRPAGTEPASTTARAFDPFAAEFVRDPYPVLARLQQEEPVFYATSIGSWIITRHSAVRSILADTKRFSARIASDPLTPLCAHARSIIAASEFDVPGLLVNNDPPDHSRYRKFFGEPLKSQHIDSLQPFITSLVERYIDDMLRVGPPHDLAKGLSWDIPALVLFRLLGIPDADIPVVKDYADSRVILLWGRPTQDEQIVLTQKAVDFFGYTKRLVELRIANPRDDYPSKLLRQREGDAQAPTIREIVAVTFNLLFAGHETTSSATANLLSALLHRTDLWQSLVAGGCDVAKLVEEGLRWAPPVQAWRRLAKEDVEIDGVSIPAGSHLLLHFGAANRDPDVFHNSADFCPARNNNMKHVSFGAGAHFCLGAPLAKMEIGTMISRLAARIPTLRLNLGQSAEYLPNTSFRGLRQLSVTW
jgi:cytochrome P450